MEVAERCEGCGEARMVLDAIFGVLACDSCGRVGNQMETELKAEFQTGHLIERGGTLVSGNDSGASAVRGLMRGHGSHIFNGNCPPGNDRLRVETMKRIESITALLRVPGDKVDDAKHLLESTIDGNWGTGRWVDILGAACVYIVIRQGQCPVTIPEVADCVQCDIFELGRMYNRVLQKLEIKLPIVDAFVFLERAASTLPALTKLSKDMVRKVKKQGSVLLDYAQEWFITTGRRPLPVVAAVLTVVVEANKVAVEIAEVARQLHAGIWATKKRYKECQIALVGIAQSLPWGRDVTLKTVLRHLPFLLQFLEVKMKVDRKNKGRASQTSLALTLSEREPSLNTETLDCHLLPVVPQKLSAPGNSKSTHQESNQMWVDLVEGQPCPSKRPLESPLCDPQECDANKNGAFRPPSMSSKNDQEIDAPSHDPCMHGRPSKLLRMTSLLCGATNLSSDCNPQRSGHTFAQVNLVCADHDDLAEDQPKMTELSISTKDHLAQSGFSTAVEQKQQKWEGLPVAFCASVEARTRRRVKIDLAKSRIFEVKKALAKKSGQVSCLVGLPNPVQSIWAQSAKDAELFHEHNDNSLDWEDFIIEYLVLRGANETELENGYYRSLLAHYSEQGTELMGEEELATYLRSKSEVELVLELTSSQGGFLNCPPLFASSPPS